MSDSERLLQVEGISKSFGGVRAVNNFSVSLDKNQIIGIIGPNGAGKTTIFNLLSHIYDADEGKIMLKGNDITGNSQIEIARMGLSRTFQNTRLFAGLDVLSNVKVGLDNSGQYSMIEAFFHVHRYRSEEKRIEREAMECLEILNLHKYAQQRPSSLAYGIQRRVEIARAIAGKPSVLLLDEPAAGLNPGEVEDLIKFIAEIKEKYDFSILIIEHRIDVIISLCQLVYVQDFGNTIAVGTPEQIRKNEAVQAAYLGEEE